MKDHDCIVRRPEVSHPVYQPADLLIDKTDCSVVPMAEEADCLRFKWIEGGGYVRGRYCSPLDRWATSVGVKAVGAEGLVPGEDLVVERYVHVIDRRRR